MFGNPGAATGESYDLNLVEITLQVPKSPRLIALDERQRFIEPGEHVRSRNVRARIVDDDRNAAKDQGFYSHDM